jgi:hypothetical protein
MNSTTVDSDIFNIIEFDYKFIITVSSYNVSKVDTYVFTI